MKLHRTTLLAMAASLTFAWGLATPMLASAQGAQQAAAAPQLPAGFKIVLDNEHVRVFESTFAPGVAVPARFYPRRTSYVIKGPAQMTSQYADGKVETTTSEPGSVRTMAAGMQAISNVGNNEVVVLIVIDKRDLPRHSSAD